MENPCSRCRPATDLERAIAKQKLEEAVQLAIASGSGGVKKELSRASFADEVEGMESISMYVVVFPSDSFLAKHYLAFTVDLLLRDSTEKIAAELKNQIHARTPWWRRILGR